MSPAFCFMKIFKQEIEAFGVARVVASENPEYEKGDLVVGVVTWAEYSKIGSNGMIRKLDPMGFPLSYHVGILGNLFHHLISL